MKGHHPVRLPEKVFADGLLQDRVVLITGGGTGIGLATAVEMAALGARIAIASRKQQHLDAGSAAIAAAGSDVEVEAVPCDIRDPEQVDAMVARVKERFGRIDVLVNNAGGQFPSPAEAISANGFHAVIRLNLEGTFSVTRSVASQCMIPQRFGIVVNIIANVIRGFPGMAHTGAARAGVDNLTKTLSVEWAQHGIRVNAVAPGVIRSSGTEQYGDVLLEVARQRTPLKRMGTVEEVAHLITYLASDAAAFVTGATWYLDGGASLWGDNWIVPEAEEEGPSR